MKDYRLHTALAVALCSVVGASTAVRAHDTNTSHPRITEMVVKSLKELDAKDAAYYQLYQTHPDYLTAQIGKGKQTVDMGKPYPYLWGYDPMFKKKPVNAMIMKLTLSPIKFMSLLKKMMTLGSEPLTRPN